MRVHTAVPAGVERFRYVGLVLLARAFCSDRVGHVYSLSEIIRMDDGQGLLPTNM